MPVTAKDVKFSILVLSIPARIESMASLIRRLQDQADSTGQAESVEILVLLDNRSKSISEKRNDLLRSARGSYLAFLDDDDLVSNDYIHQILDVIDSHGAVDCISFNQRCSIDGEPMNVEFGIGNPHGQLWRNDQGMLGDIKRPPYHMCVWRREIAQSEEFNPMIGPNFQSYGEDIDWLLRLYPKVCTEHHIDAVLHSYLYCSKTTTSRV